MAKKKKGAAQPSGFAAMSPEKYIRTQARSLPLGKCYVTKGWQEGGECAVLVSRERPSGNLVGCLLLVDTFCLGVKDVIYNHNMLPTEFGKLVDHVYGGKVGEACEESTYAEVHNLVYGAIEFAEEAGIEPVQQWNIAEYILEEDTDDIPLIEYEYGRNGKHLLVCSPGGKEKLLIPQLRERLGEKFDFIYSNDDGYDEDAAADGWDGYDEDEHYSYEYPEYPTELSVRHPEVTETLYGLGQEDVISKEQAQALFALGADELAADLDAVILHEIGRTYRRINEDLEYNGDNSVIENSVLLLACVDSGAALPALLELIRMNGAFADVHLGDIGMEHLPQALWHATKGNLRVLGEFLKEKGLNIWLRLKAVEALTLAYHYTPGAQEEVISLFRGFLEQMVSRHESGEEEIDPSFAGCVVGQLMDFDSTELLPEVERLFGTNMVDYGSVGDLANVKDIYRRKDFYPPQELFTLEDMISRLED